MRRSVQGEHPSSLVWLLFFVYICFCSRQVPYCSGSVKHANMLCWYSHSIVATSKITDCPRALHPFYSRTGHVSSSRWFTQWVCIIASNPLPPAKHLLLMWFDLSDLHIWDWLVQCEHLNILTAYHQQTALLTLGHFTLHFSFPISTCPRSLLMDSSLPFTRPFLPQALFPLTHTDCLETFFLKF